VGKKTNKKWGIDDWGNAIPIVGSLSQGITEVVRGTGVSGAPVEMDREKVFVDTGPVINRGEL